MSFFPRSFYGSSADPSFTPLFRLLDDFDTYSREVQDGSGSNNANARGGGNVNNRRHSALRSFSPKFDVRETADAYELHGELPGAERENVQIEFTEPQTLVIRGHVERTYTSGTPPSGLVDGAGNKKAIEAGEHQKPHKATVEDEKDEQAGEKGRAAGGNNQVAKTDKNQHHLPVEKYWVSERSVGDFSRTFSFPARVDQDNVQANLKEGILTILVPKARKRESKRISVN